ncbi:hypothetical protein F4803DRAFT_337244 [Xylaria telfairii]|nr:hypothetical protein F4803DRAFT_337244 [Xylaria telfairii]
MSPLSTCRDDACSSSHHCGIVVQYTETDWDYLDWDGTAYHSRLHLILHPTSFAPNPPPISCLALPNKPTFVHGILFLHIGIIAIFLLSPSYRVGKLLWWPPSIDPRANIYTYLLSLCAVHPVLQVPPKSDPWSFRPPVPRLPFTSTVVRS